MVAPSRRAASAKPKVVAFGSAKPEPGSQQGRADIVHAHGGDEPAEIVLGDRLRLDADPLLHGDVGVQGLLVPGGHHLDEANRLKAAVPAHDPGKSRKTLRLSKASRASASLVLVHADERAGLAAGPAARWRRSTRVIRLDPEARQVECRARPVDATSDHHHVRAAHVGIVTCLTGSVEGL